MKILPDKFGCLVPATLVGVVIGGIFSIPPAIPPGDRFNNDYLLNLLFWPVFGAVVGFVIDADRRDTGDDD